MPSNSKKDENRKRREHQKELRTTALALIGFKSMAELAKAAGVYDADLSNISKGTRKPSDEIANKIICAIRDQNCDKGWTYLQSAQFFREAFEYLRSHFAAQNNSPVPPIHDLDVDRWCASHIERLALLQSEFDEPLNIAAFYHCVETSLEGLLRFTKSWEMKHDFGHLGKVKHKFKTNDMLFIRPTVLKGMEEERYYDQIKLIYTEIRHIAHLCGAVDLVTEMSDWLGSRAGANGDIQTEVQAKVTQAWILTSQNTRKSLYEARDLVQDVEQAMHRHGLLKVLPVEQADVVAILAELRLRLVIRYAKRYEEPLSEGEFETLLSESRTLLESASSFHDSTLRFKARYSIPLDYQKGVYLHHIGNYQDAQAKFESIIADANYIGWTRVEQAAYTWLATQLEALGDRDRCTEVLDKINVLCLKKRQLISQHIRARIEDHE